MAEEAPFKDANIISQLFRPYIAFAAKSNTNQRAPKVLGGRSCASLFFATIVWKGANEPYLHFFLLHSGGITNWM
jgi:hypothetical protein